MFPYSSTHGGHDFWTGYFTSRANAKEHVRQTSSALSASGSLFAAKVLSDSDEQSKQAVLDATYDMMDAVGILQHHDAITGTAKQAVADNYEQILSKANAINDVQYCSIIGEQVEAMTQLKGEWHQCERMNFTFSGNEMYVAVHNPASIAQKYVEIDIPVKQNVSYKLLGWSDESGDFDVSIPQRVVPRLDVEAHGNTLIADLEVPAHSVRVAKLVLANITEPNK